MSQLHALSVAFSLYMDPMDQSHLMISLFFAMSLVSRNIISSILDILFPPYPLDIYPCNKVLLDYNYILEWLLTAPDIKQRNAYLPLEVGLILGSEILSTRVVLNVLENT